jgi:hypothetical protein
MKRYSMEFIDKVEELQDYEVKLHVDKLLLAEEV